MYTYMYYMLKQPEEIWEFGITWFTDGMCVCIHVYIYTCVLYIHTPVYKRFLHDVRQIETSF